MTTAASHCANPEKSHAALQTRNRGTAMPGLRIAAGHSQVIEMQVAHDKLTEGKGGAHACSAR
jgi:hypothetical protein